MSKLDLNVLEVNGIKYVREDSIENKPIEVDGMKAVLIRSRDAGVHFGYLKKEEFTQSGKVVVLINTRRVWYWDGASSLSQMALEGVKKPDNCRFSVIVPENEIVNVIETINLTSTAIENLYKVRIWRQ